MTGKALLVAYGGGHITMMAPVIAALQKRGVDCTVMALTTGYRKALQLGLQPLGYRDFSTLIPDADRVLAWGRALLGKNSHPDVSTEESLWYLGVNFAEWVAQMGEAGAWAHYHEHGRRAFYPVSFMWRVLRSVWPDVVITTNTPRSEGAAIEAAIGLGIPCLSMVDLPVQPSDPFCQRKCYADRVTAPSDAVMRSLLRAGLPPDRLVVTGNPAFDTLRSPEAREGALAYRRARGWEGKRVILYAGHGEEMPGTPAEWQGVGFGTLVQQWLRDWVASHADDALIIRYHPSESHLYPLLPPHPRMARSEPSVEPLHPVLLASDIVVVQTSTVGLEAALAARRVLCLTFATSVKQASYNYPGLGLAEAADSFEDLAHRLAVLGSSPTVDPADYYVGESAQRVAEEVMTLMHIGAADPPPQR